MKQDNCLAGLKPSVVMPLLCTVIRTEQPTLPHGLILGERECVWERGIDL